MCSYCLYLACMTIILKCKFTVFVNMCLKRMPQKNALKKWGREKSLGKAAKRVMQKNECMRASLPYISPDSAVVSSQHASELTFVFFPVFALSYVSITVGFVKFNVYNRRIACPCVHSVIVNSSKSI